MVKVRISNQPSLTVLTDCLALLMCCVPRLDVSTCERLHYGAPNLPHDAATKHEVTTATKPMGAVAQHGRCRELLLVDPWL